MSDGPFKEQHRQAMVEWSEAIRAQDEGYFCERALRETPDCDIMVCLTDLTFAFSYKPPQIVADARRPSDLHFFASRYRYVLKIRIEASEAVRAQRGYTFTSGIDDAETECALDKRTDWDLIVHNNSIDYDVSVISDIVRSRVQK